MFVHEPQIRVACRYGVGETAEVALPRKEATGLTLRRLLARLVEAPQSGDAAARTAAVLSEVLVSGRIVDAELVVDAGGRRAGPIAFDDVVLPDRSADVDEEELEDEKVAFVVSEPFRGGAAGRRGA